MKKFWLICILLVVCRLLAAFILPTFDDAYITFRYAFNLASGHGLVYNPGEKVMGTTAPLFAVLASIPHLLSISVPRFFFVFNLLCDLASLYLIFRYFFKGRTDGWFCLFAALFAFDPMISRISIGGMEADLFLLVSLSGLILYLNGRKTVAAAVLAMAYFLRPEAVLLLFIVTVYELYSTRKIPFLQGITALVVLAVPLACIYTYYGQILPQSVIAKSAAGREPFLHLLKMVFFPDPLFFLVFPLAVVGFMSNYRKDRLYLLAGCWIFCYGLAYLAKAPHPWSWYFFSIDTLQLAFAALGVQALAERFRSGWQLPSVVQYLVLTLPLAIWGGVLFYKGRSGVEQHVYGELRKDFPDPAELKGKVFFADDIGALGYFTQAYIYDNQKLVTPQASQYADTRDRILHVQPDYLFVYTDDYYLDLIRKDSLLSSKYSFVKRYAISGEKELPAANDPVGNEYRQDYMLFRRNP